MLTPLNTNHESTRKCCGEKGKRGFHILLSHASDYRAERKEKDRFDTKYPQEKYILSNGQIRVNSYRWVSVGDFVVHKELGVGQYIGLKMIQLTPDLKEPAVVVRYIDGEVTWLKRFVEKELWLYSYSDGAQDISKTDVNSFVDVRKWKRRKGLAEENSKAAALSMLRLTAIRNSLFRPPYIPNEKKYHEFERQFNYTPSVDQLECFKNIGEDMVNKTVPMDRLICGDVGFGKTEVAMRAIYRSILSNRQCALLAPTRVLALQHLRVLRNRMPDVNIQLLRGRKGDSKQVKEDVASGRCEVVVGTHALLQSDVQFRNLGLIVVDEEQRFGVLQKEKLKTSSKGIDVLTLSATPIPRTLQMAMSGLRDLSLINTPPQGRMEVRVYVGQDDDNIVRDAITAEVNRGGQVFVVVPFIEDIAELHERLTNLLPRLTVIIAHGQLDDLEDRIDVFASGQADILVSTTVIENGIDMPNVNTIIVLNAHRFGISALYQLRGRVGRSSKQAYGYFLTKKGHILTVEAENRLTYIKTFTALGSGYDLARRDMEMRGHGTIFGSDQSGVRDVGFDLHAAILKTTINEIKQQYILPVPETRVAWEYQIVSYGEKHLQSSLPVLTFNNNSEVRASIAITRWENSLAALILSQFTSIAGIGAAGGGLDLDLERRVSEVLGCHDYESVLLIQQKYEGKMSPMIEELFLRLLLRILCRRLGVYSVDNIGNGVSLRTTEITTSKWCKIQDSVPLLLKSSVFFECLNDAEDGKTHMSHIVILHPKQGDTLEAMKMVVDILHPLAEKASDILNSATAEESS